ncbi:MAG TPA: hypothetical protein VHM02_01435 [Thermoanaerobaculia bacterium]|nr:hypothetical protein [Thermoanaerobaculia bacterium]
MAAERQPAERAAHLRRLGRVDLAAPALLGQHVVELEVDEVRRVEGAVGGEQPAGRLGVRLVEEPLDGDAGVDPKWPRNLPGT